MDENSGKTVDYHSKVAFVVGHTGEVGKELVKGLLQRQIFHKLVLIGRKPVQLEGDLNKHAVENVIIDFEALDKHKKAFANCSVGFCCLGTTRGKAGKDGFVKVDHDYVVQVAKMARESGVEHFSVVSAAGADKNSFFLYPKTKGLMEEEVAQVGFPRLTIFRPGFLLCDRQESRFGERAAKALLSPIFWAKPTSFSVPTTTVANAMIADLWRKPAKNVEIIGNAGIHEMAKNVQEAKGK